MVPRFALTLLAGAVLAQLSTHAGVFTIGHRGDDLFAPENTLPSFSSALAKKAEFVEFDVRASSDNVLVIMHDTTVDRTTDGTGSIASLTLAQLQALDAGSWFSIGEGWLAMGIKSCSSRPALPQVPGASLVRLGYRSTTAPIP